MLIQSFHPRVHTIGRGVKDLWGSRISQTRQIFLQYLHTNAPQKWYGDPYDSHGLFPPVPNVQEQGATGCQQCNAART